MLELLLIVGQDPRQPHVVGYNLDRPMYGSLSPRKVDGDNDTIITQFDVNTADGDIIITANKPILGTTPTLTLATGETVALAYAGDIYTGQSVPFTDALKVGNCVKVIVDTTAVVATTSPQATTTPQASPTVNLDGMTKAELIKYAGDNGIVVDASLTKALMLKIIKSA